MKVIYGIGRLRLKENSCVTVGVFDGVHRGHQDIIRRVVCVARTKKLQSVVITFFPHPEAVIHAKNVPPLLISLQHRLALIALLGVDVCVVVRFSPAIRAISAADFIEQILLAKCRMSVFVLSRNFSFGKNRRGTIALLKRYASTARFQLLFLRPRRVDTKIVSSTLIRFSIRSGKLAQAARFLGRRVEVLGTVVGGDRRGRTLGFPTANIDPHHEVIPPSGVYAVTAWIGAKRFVGVANIGKRPTFGASPLQTIELHIMRFQNKLYGRHVRIVFYQKVRNEQSFSHKEALIKQIRKDIRKTLVFFRKTFKK